MTHENRQIQCLRPCIESSVFVLKLVRFRISSRAIRMERSPLTADDLHYELTAAKSAPS
jgi:hypothetical protein